MQIETRKAIHVTECLGSTLDGVAHALRDAEWQRPIVDDDIVITDVEHVERAILCVDLDPYPVIGELFHEIHQMYHNESDVDLDTAVIFKG